MKFSTSRLIDGICIGILIAALVVAIYRLDHRSTFSEPLTETDLPKDKSFISFSYWKMRDSDQYLVFFSEMGSKEVKAVVLREPVPPAKAFRIPSTWPHKVEIFDPMRTEWLSKLPVI